jgi:hypothetical protein
MSEGARTPEELETLLEDAFVVRDPAVLATLFEPGAVAVAGETGTEARGPQAIARVAAAAWSGGHTFVAAPRRVLQRGATALILGPGSLSVVRRGQDGRWRYAIAVLSFCPDEPPAAEPHEEDR